MVVESPTEAAQKLPMSIHKEAQRCVQLQFTTVLMQCKVHAPCRYGWSLGLPELQAGITVLEKERRKPNFGNAGAVNNLLSATAQRMEARIQHLTPRERVEATPTPQDIDPETGSSIDPAAVFDDLIGCKQVPYH